MGSSLGFLLSLFFSIQVMAYVGDLTTIQQIYSVLDTMAVTAGHLISLEGGISKDIQNYVEEKANAYILPLGKDYVEVGGVYEFLIYRKYEPIIISRDVMVLEVTRSVMIGYID
jgi:hypothetical protein